MPLNLPRAATGSTGEAIPVFDPFGVAADPDLPLLAQAVDPSEVQRQFEQRLTTLAGGSDSLRVQAIRVVRYKPHRRCMIEYDVEVDGPQAGRVVVTLLGKVRVHRFGNSGYRLLKALWQTGFDDKSDDGISVPEPVGTVPAFQMWLQRKVPGSTATHLLSPAPPARTLVRRIAEAAHKLHEAGVAVERRHTIADELRILRECLSKVAQTEPRWARRLERLVHECDRIGASLPQQTAVGIHRDFYADQVIVDAGRLYLIDFDLYCEGDPGLDVGNFIGHIAEQSVRTHGDPEALAGLEQAMEDRFVELAREQRRAEVRAYAAFTLVRHIYLSTRFPGRRAFTGRLLELAEFRVGSGSVR